MYIDRLVAGAGRARGVGGVGITDAMNAERVCLAVRPHWFRIVKQGAGSLLLIACGVALAMAAGPLAKLVAEPISRLRAPAAGRGGAGDYTDTFAALAALVSSIERVLVWAGIPLALMGVALLGWALLSRHFTEYGIIVSPGLGGRIIKVQGVFSRETVAVPLGMVNDLALYEPLLGRLLGWGDIDIETGNDYQGDRLEHVPNPKAFYEVWQTVLDHRYERRGPTGRGERAPL
jgi:hypothetical protein